MVWLFGAASVVLAHGGEVHSPPPATLTQSGLRIAATSGATDAVLHIGDPHTGEQPATLLLADWATSAPLELSAARLQLSGPAALSPTLVAAGPGTWATTLSLPAPGDYAGSLVLEGAKADLLAITGISIGLLPEGGVASVGGSPWALLGVGLGGLLLGALIARRPRSSALVGGLLVAAHAQGHGGEVHNPQPPSRSSGNSALDLPLDAQFLVGLRTLPAHRAAVAPQVQGIGHFVGRPGSIATLRAPVPGLLGAPESGFPSPGASVRAGDLLGLLAEIPVGADRAALARERAEALTSVARARSELELAERDAAQASGLGAAISDRERMARAGALSVAREALAQAEAAAVALGKGGPTWPLRAPLSGQLAHIDARPGDQVEPGDSLFRIVDGAATLWVEVRVPEAAALGVIAGAAAQVTVGALPGLVLPAVVLDAGQEADPATGQLTLTLAVQGDDPLIRPGMTATAWIDAGPKNVQLLVPDDALVDSDNTPLVFVKSAPERFTLRPVQAGPRVGAHRVIRAGVDPGERVVVAGTAPLRSLAGR